MSNINTNAVAITALRTFQNTNAQLDATQNRIPTGLEIGGAKDNAAYRSISTTLKSDNKSLSTVEDGSATVDVAYLLAKQDLRRTEEDRQTEGVGQTRPHAAMLETIQEFTIGRLVRPRGIEPLFAP